MKKKNDRERDVGNCEIMEPIMQRNHALATTKARKFE